MMNLCFHYLFMAGGTFLKESYSWSNNYRNTVVLFLWSNYETISYSVQTTQVQIHEKARKIACRPNVFWPHMWFACSASIFTWKYRMHTCASECKTSGRLLFFTGELHVIIPEKAKKNKQSCKSFSLWEKKHFFTFSRVVTNPQNWKTGSWQQSSKFLLQPRP